MTRTRKDSPTLPTARTARAPRVAAPQTGPSEIGSVKPDGQWHHGDLRASLIQWGSHLLDTQGVDGMSLRATARLAGVSQGAPAHHFKDKNGLLAAIAAQGFRDMLAMRSARRDSVAPDDAKARLRAVMLTYVEFAQAFPARFHLMYGPQIERRDDYAELVEAGRASFRLVRESVVPLLPAHYAGSLSHNDIAFAVWAATHGLATLRMYHQASGSARVQQRKADQLCDVVVRFCLAGIGHVD